MHEDDCLKSDCTRMNVDVCVAACCKLMTIYEHNIIHAAPVLLLNIQVYCHHSYFGSNSYNFNCNKWKKAFCNQKKQLYHQNKCLQLRAMSWMLKREQVGQLQKALIVLFCRLRRSLIVSVTHSAALCSKQTPATKNCAIKGIVTKGKTQQGAISMSTHISENLVGQK